MQGFPFIEEDSELMEATSPVPAPTPSPAVPQNTGSNATASMPVCGSMCADVFAQDDAGTPEERMKARHAVLLTLPIPSNMPTDTLIPFVIPSPFTIHDFLGTVQGESKTQSVFSRIIPPGCMLMFDCQGSKLPRVPRQHDVVVPGPRRARVLPRTCLQMHH